MEPLSSPRPRSLVATTAFSDAVHDSSRSRLLDWYESAVRASAVVRAGPAAIRACVAETGLHAHTLRRWAFAASRFDRAEVESLARWRDSSGRGLSVWHLVEMARLPSPRRALLLGEMELLGLWPVARVRGLVRYKKRPQRAPGST